MEEGGREEGQETVYRGTFKLGGGLAATLLMDYVFQERQPVTMPAGGVTPCPVLIRQDSTGCVDVLALTLRGLVSGMPMPTTSHASRDT